MTRPATYRPMLLSSGVHVSAARHPHKPAIIFEGQILSYGAFSERVRMVCGAAMAAGLRRGDRAAILAPNCLAYAELVVGLSDAGAIVATLNPRSTTHELMAACDDCGATILFVHPVLASVVSSARFASVTRVIYLDDGYAAWLAAATPSLPRPEIEETDPFTLVYSSGTTGKPKGIVVSHRSRVLTFHAMAMEYGCYGPDDIQLGLAPMAHGAGFAFIMATLFFGGTVEIMPKFDPAMTLAALAARPFTSVFMVPTHFQAIFSLEAGELECHRGRTPALRSIISNAAALPQAVKEKIIAYWGEGLLHECYGSTEAGIVTNLRPAHQLTRRQSVGLPFALNTVRLVDEKGSEVSPGTIGELYSRSPYLFNDYWNQPLETAATVHDGWVTAGDLAQRDEDGFIYIVDRKKDMVVTGGINVYPREIEEVLHRHPAVIEAAVVGVPDEYFGEALRAFIVVRPGMNVAAGDLDALCRTMLAGYKVPKEFRVIAALPRNAGGKVLKKELRATTSS